MDLFAIYSRTNRNWISVVAILLIVAIAAADSITPSWPVGYLYLLPILLLAGFLPRKAIAFIVIMCATFTALLSRYDLKQSLILFVLAGTGFAGTGLFVSEIVRNRQSALEHVREMTTQIRLRQETEGQLRGLVDSSPLAIITVAADGHILLANDAAQELLSPRDVPILGQSIAEFLPALETVAHQPRSTVFRTQLRCSGKRKNGEVFSAAVWFSTSPSGEGSVVQAIIVDFSEDLRDREDLSLEHLLKNAKILVGAIAHEIRNLCGAALVVYRNLSKIQSLNDNEDFRALGNLIGGLEKLSAMELQPSREQGLASIELSSVLDELRVVIEPVYAESGMKILWRIQEKMPLVIGDRYGLQQVFLNLARNSQRAMESAKNKQLTISSAIESGAVVIRFEDTGTGITHPAGLFQPFQQSAGATGLGLYVSRAILRSFHGDLRHEPGGQGCCFAIRLTQFANVGDM